MSGSQHQQTVVDGYWEIAGKCADPPSFLLYRIKRNESCSSLSNFVHYDFLQQRLKSLEDENRKLRLEVRRQWSQWCYN